MAQSHPYVIAGSYAPAIYSDAFGLVARHSHRGRVRPGYEASSIFGIGAPENTPAEIIDKLNKEINDGLADLIALTSMPSDGATDWITAYWPIPAEAGSRRTAVRVTFGAICLRSSSHFPHKLYSNVMNPVALPPGRARLLTKPSPTGSTTITNTIGMVWVACSIGGTAGLPETRMTSGASAANSAAYFRASMASAPGQRSSICTFRPSVQPNCCSP